MPPRPNGTAALLRGSPDADLVLLTHVGLEGLDRVLDASKRIPLTDPVRVRLVRIPHVDIPGTEGPGDTPGPLRAWLDGIWLEMDEWVDGASAHPAPAAARAATVAP